MLKAVIGMGFGDEGKGCTTSWLSSLDATATVVRYSGGPQAGHHVVRNGMEHIFASFGSGTLSGNSTYISAECVVDPLALLKEYEVLLTKGLEPDLSINERCPLITPLDILNNRCDDETMNHGTCGCGINSTLRREDDHHSITVGDIRYPEILEAKLRSLSTYYYDSGIDWDPNRFLQACTTLGGICTIVEAISNDQVQNVIFEGSQGLLLDKDIGIFPHVTPYNVGLRGIGTIVDEAYYVTRAYSTRHGNGPMFSPTVALAGPHNPNETNVTNEYQGEFRTGVLNADVLQYALNKDGYKFASEKNILVVTCLEHMETLSFCHEGTVYEFELRSEFCNALAKILGMDKYVMCVAHVFRKISEVV